MNPRGLALCAFLTVTLTLSLHAEEGFASFYAGKFQGRLTANGEIFDTKKLTAAHKTLAFNTIVRVTDSENGRSVLVRINDRGPYVEGRIIDLSRAAAAAIGMVSRGIARVSVEVITKGNGATYHRDGYHPVLVILQLGAFGERQNAEQLKKSLEAEGFDPSFEKTREGVIRVILSGIAREDVIPTKARLQTLGHKVVVRAR